MHHFLGIFTNSWEHRKLGEACRITTGFPFKSEDFRDDGNFLVLTNGNIQDDSPEVNDLSGNRILFREDSGLSKYVLDIDDILVTMDGTVGRSAKVAKHGQILAQRVARISGSLCQDYIFQILRAGAFEKEMAELSHGGTIKHISLNEIESFAFMCPSDLEEIKAISSCFNKIDTTIVLHQREC
jgi:type I restriction enzyme S subunit